MYLRQPEENNLYYTRIFRARNVFQTIIGERARRGSIKVDSFSGLGPPSKMCPDPKKEYVQ